MSNPSKGVCGYLEQRTKEEYALLKEWDRQDIPCQPSKFYQLVLAAANAKASKKHTRIMSDYSEEDSKLIDIFERSILFGKSFNDENIPEGYMTWSDDMRFAIEAHYIDGFLEFELHTGCGSCIVCTYVKKTKYRTYKYEYFKNLITQKIKAYRKGLARIKKANEPRDERIAELSQKLAMATALETLSDALGFKIGAADRKKINKWQAEIAQLRRG